MLVEELRAEAMRAPVRAKALLDGWERAVLLRGGELPKRAMAKTAATALLHGTRQKVDVGAYFKKHDVNRLFASTVALSAVRAATDTGHEWPFGRT